MVFDPLDPLGVPMPDQPVESVVPEVPWDRTPMTYSIVPPTDENGDLIPPGLPLDEQLKADLEAEIDARNEGRADDARLLKVGTKADLIAALEADDAAHLPDVLATQGEVNVNY